MRSISHHITPLVINNLGHGHTHTQTHTHTHIPLAHLQDLIPTFAGIKYKSDNTSQSRDKIL